MAARWIYAWGVGSAAFGGASLLVPLYVVQLGGTPADLGLLAGTAALGGAPGAVAFGRLADRIGHRRRLVLATLLTVAVTLAVIPLLADVLAVIVANTALWLVVGAVYPVLTMTVVDAAPPSAWSERIGRLNAVQGYGWAAGLVLGTVWPLVGTGLVGAAGATRTLFWVLAGCAVAAVAGAAATLPRPASSAHVTAPQQVRRIARLVARSGREVRGATLPFAPDRLYWTNRGIQPRALARARGSGLVRYLVAATLMFAGSAAFWAPLPIVLTEAGLGSAQVFGVYLASSLASAALYDRAGTAATRVDPGRLQAAAFLLRGAAFPAVAAVVGLGTLQVAVGAVTMGLLAVGATWAVIAVVGTLLVTRLAPPAVRGEALGVHTALGAVAGGVGGVLGGWLATHGPLAAFGVAGGLVVLGALVLATLGSVDGGPPDDTSPGGETRARDVGAKR